MEAYRGVKQAGRWGPGTPPSLERYPRGSEAVADLRGAEVLLDCLLVGKSFGSQEAGELGHWAAVSEEPGREGQVARARGPAGGWGCAFPPSTAGRAAPRHSLAPLPPPGPQHSLRRTLCPSAHVAEAWVSPLKRRLETRGCCRRVPWARGPHLPRRLQSVK